MKKRILSMLLLVAMVLTAVPLFAFAALAADGVAAEKPTYEEEDYNDLYVKKDNLVYAADFFVTNEHWDHREKPYTPNANANTNMKNMLAAYRWKGTRILGGNANYSDNNAVAIGDGKLAISHPGSWAEFGVDSVHLDMKNGYNGATQEIVRSVAKKEMILFVAGTRFAFDASGRMYAVGNGGTGDAAVGTGNFNIDHYSTRIPLPFDATGVHTYTTSILRPEPESKKTEVVGPSGDYLPDVVTKDGVVTARYYFYTANSKKTVYVDPETQAITTEFTEGYEAKIVLEKSEKTYINVNGRANPYVMITPDFILEDGVYTPNTEAVPILIERFTPATGKAYAYQDGTLYYENEALAYLNNDYGIQNNIITWGSATSGGWGDVYALRYYDCILDADDVALNHAADLAKFFRLDIGAYRALSEADRLAVAKKMAGYTFESERDGENGVAAVFAGAVLDVTIEGYDGDLALNYVEIALDYGLDHKMLSGLPIYCRENTYAMLDQLIAGTYDPDLGKSVPEAYFAALAADAAAIAAESEGTVEDYNALYIDGGNLVLGADFLATSTHWGDDKMAATGFTAYTYKSLNESFLRNGAGGVIGNGYFHLSYKNALDIVTRGWNEDKVGFTVEHVLEFAADEGEGNNTLGTTSRVFYTRGLWYGISAAPTFNKSGFPMTVSQMYQNTLGTYGSTGLGAYWNTITYMSVDSTLMPLEIGAGAETFSFAYNFKDYIDVPLSGTTALNNSRLVTRDHAPLILYLTGRPHALNQFRTSAPIKADTSKLIWEVVKTTKQVSDGTTSTETLERSGLAVDVDSPTGSAINDIKNLTKALLKDTTRFPADNAATAEGGVATETYTYTLGNCVGYEGDGVYGLPSQFLAPNQTIDQIGYGGSFRGNIYAIRYYDRTLTATEISINHFADVAKYYRLNLTGLDLKDPAVLAALGAAVADIRIGVATRAEAQAAILAVVDDAIDAAYAPVVEARGSYGKVTKDYRLDPAALLALPAGALFNINVFFDDLTSGEFSGDAAAIIAAYSEAATADMAAYAALGTYSYADYDKLYADGLFDAVDFFSLNEYWKDTWTGGVAPALPLAPGLDSQYDGKRMDATADFIIVRYTKGSSLIDKAYGSNGSMKLDWVDASNTIAYSKTPSVASRTFTFATKEAAEEVLNALTKDTATYTYAVVRLPKATTEYQTAIDTYKDSIKSTLATYTRNKKLVMGASLPTISAISYHDQDGTIQGAAGILGAATETDRGGYLQLTNAFSNQSFLELSGYEKKGLLTAEYVMTSGANKPTSVHNNYITFSDVAVSKDNGKLTQFMEYNGTTYTGVGENSAATLYHINSTNQDRVLFNGQFFTVGATNAKEDVYGVIVDRGNGKGASINASLWMNGAEIVKPVTAKDTSADSARTFLGYSNASENRVYALRVYERALTAEDYAQNHFADVAKFFRLNLNGIDLENETMMKQLYAAVADISLAGSTRGEAQAAVSAILTPALLAVYEDLAKNDAENADFYGTVGNYFIDLGALFELAEKRDMSTVFAVTAAAFAGCMTLPEVQAVYDNLVHDAYYYWSYGKDSTDKAYTDFLAVLAKDDLSAEAFMALPIADRLDIIEEKNPADQAALDAAVAAEMKKYEDFLNTYEEKDYNALYADQENLIFAADFFAANEHWNTPRVEGVDYEKGSDWKATTNNMLNAYAWKQVSTDGRGGRKTGFSIAASYEGHTEFSGGKFTVIEAAWDDGGWWSGDQFGVSNIEFVTSGYGKVSGDAENGYTYEGGATQEIVRAISNHEKAGYTYHFVAGARFGINPVSGEFVRVGYGDVVSYNPVNKKVQSPLAAHTYTSSVARLPAEGNVNDVTANVYTPVWVDAEGNLTVEGTEGAIMTVDTTTKSASQYSSRTNALYKLTPEKVWNGTALVDNEGNAAYYILLDQYTAAEGYTGMYQDGVLIDENHAFKALNSPWGVSNNILCWSSCGWGDFYAVRYYSSVLTQDSVKQNHFVDLAKYFKLDITTYLLMDAEMRKDVHEVFDGYTVEAERAVVVEALITACLPYYKSLKVTEDGALNAKLQAFAAATTLDVTHLSKVKGDDALVAEILALGDLNYAFSTAVINYRLANEILEFYGLNKLVTFGARVHSDYVADKAGIRATFAINTDLFKAMFAKDGAPAEIFFGTDVYSVTKQAHFETLTFVAVKNGDDIEYYKVNKDNTREKIKTKILQVENDKGVIEEVLTYTWTLTSENLSVSLNAEWSYERFVKIGDGTRYSIAVVSEKYGDTVTMREIYEAAAKINPDDVVVQKVLAAMNAQ